MNLNTLYKARYKEYFNSDSDYWDEIYRRTTFYGYHYQKRRQVIARLVAETGLGSGARVLDAGCGAGAYFPIYLSRGLRVDGIDISESMITKAAELNKHGVDCGNICVRTGDLEALPYEPETFNLIVSSGVLMYLPTLDGALSGLWRVLTKEGYAIINVDNHRNLAALLDVPRILYSIWGKLARRFGFGVEDAENAEPLEPVTKTYRPLQLMAALQRNGFSLVTELGHGFGPIRLFGRTLFSDRVNWWTYRITEPLFSVPGIERWGFTYTVLVRKIP